MGPARAGTVAAVLAGVGCAGVWTFARDLLTGHGGPGPGISGALWCVLGVAGLAGGASGAVVERYGVAIAWRGSLLVAAVGTALLAVRPDVPWLAGVALAAFGASFVALSGVLIAWGPVPGRTAQRPPRPSCSWDSRRVRHWVPWRWAYWPQGSGCRRPSSWPRGWSCSPPVSPTDVPVTGETRSAAGAALHAHEEEARRETYGASTDANRPPAARG
ncbi:hypothetical protein [Blastococcus brunescens]|uniref:Major facilitator superfamily (MFS) profile domain-containing protein n=1 Tax=Blastococcus brunescens TaxID=1564165 RepID=A0ABZ1B9S6_9ACTN|nr:hypothetical protein [Blastococcus sp. BMG 8361]WRL66496.1 hypothetical protein U6N30_14425 [Blastococcus sp. BMG 8361]